MCWAPSTCGMSPPPTWSASCAASMSCSTGWPRSCVSAPYPALGPSCLGSSSSWQPSECLEGLWGSMAEALGHFFLTEPPSSPWSVCCQICHPLVPWNLCLPPHRIQLQFPQRQRWPGLPGPGWVPGLGVVLTWGSMGVAVSPEGLWFLCQPQGTKEPQFLLCGHVRPQQLGHQPPGPNLGGRCDPEQGARPPPPTLLPTNRFLRSGCEPILGVLVGTWLLPQSSDVSFGLPFTAAAPQNPEAVLSP